MKQHELLRIASSMLKAFSDNGIDAGDVKYLPLYEEYIRLKTEGHKVGYIVCYLSEKYGCSEITVYRVVKRMEQELKE